MAEHPAVTPCDRSKLIAFKNGSLAATSVNASAIGVLSLELYGVLEPPPTTLTALLNSLQMGFRTLAIEKRSSEVWQVLGAVKTEFGKFGDVLAKTKDQIQRAADTLDKAEVRTRQISRRLKDVEVMPEVQAQLILA